MRSKGNQNKFVRFITTPIRILGKARDVYVRSITDCATGVRYGQSTGGPTALPKSFSVSSTRSNNDEELRELIRAASVRTLIERIDMEMIMKQQAGGSKGLPKSCSVGMGRIDEDGPCDFEEVGVSGKGRKADLLYPRSRSYAVTNRKASPL
ncbi:hypothetical protein I3843_08G051700 [Carya illinoinensis]|uniref:Uncharacterized protein n=1 Tax=Carya illinoinensis TaxID=32201 RepID=A0A8T1PSD9_CARIL|nr:uncharacterized protein LOC122318013 [Carya illinoinensis]KAG6644371.1 hypothetical protein CIPAW_08G051100 [Carya illinoinensis]KAG6699071.1 hypothetical protein I3842_08G051800 [Carya illinoinensis]KAG7966445.1 hypothetical protein I3843_08G051700 [Carya illinoinensis]